MPHRDPSPETVQSISDWLVDAALATTELPPLIAGLCERIDAAGIGLLRATLGTHVLHPVYEAQTIRWLRGEGYSRKDFDRGAHMEADWQRSPIKAAIDRPNEMLRRRIENVADVDFDFEILRDLKTLGATDYAVMATPFNAYNRADAPTGMVVTWATDRPGGFSDRWIAALERLQPRLATAVKSMVTHQIAGDVVNAYLGRDAGTRILGGEIGRGELVGTKAVLLFCDMRGFTALADRMDLQQLVALLDGYFDAICEPIHARGGEILKFMGDGLLATFEIGDRPLAEIAHAALAAATAALGSVATINGTRAREGQGPTMDLDVALHLGDVLYGNVGALDRLDFTVIGPVVNEASRMEGLCDALGVNLILSEPLARAGGVPEGYDLKPLGAHALRGLDADREVFTLEKRKR